MSNVKISRTGAKYHSLSCHHGDIQTTLADALSRGLSPCSKCNPPSYVSPPPASFGAYYPPAQSTPTYYNTPPASPEKSVYQKEAEKLKETVALLQDKLDAAENDSRKAKAAVSSLKEQNESLKRNGESMQLLHSTFAEEKRALKRAYQEASDSLRSAEEQLDAKKMELANAKNGSKAELSKLKLELDMAKADLAKAKSQLEHTKADLANAEAQLANANQEIRNLNEEQKAKEKTQAKLKQLLVEAHEENLASAHSKATDMQMVKDIVVFLKQLKFRCEEAESKAESTAWDAIEKDADIAKLKGNLERVKRELALLTEKQQKQSEELQKQQLEAQQKQKQLEEEKMQLDLELQLKQQQLEANQKQLQMKAQLKQQQLESQLEQQKLEVQLKQHELDAKKQQEESIKRQQQQLATQLEEQKREIQLKQRELDAKQQLEESVRKQQQQQQQAPKKLSFTDTTEDLTIVAPENLKVKMMAAAAFAEADNKTGKLDASSTSEISAVRFKFDIIQEACNNFAQENIIGHGGFGNVYKGELFGAPIAVKRLDENSQQNVDHLFAELRTLSIFRHPSIVVLMGISQTAKECCLVYEQLINGSVRDRLDCKGNSDPLPWDVRVRIARQVAQGMDYLQRGQPGYLFYHLDLKSDNILLDKSFDAKISDCGLSRSQQLPMNVTGVTLVTKNITGTIGYICPEYLQKGKVSRKTDVFSYGMTVLDLLTGGAASSSLISELDKEVRRKKSIKAKLDSKLNWTSEQIVSADDLYTLIKECIDASPKYRPTFLKIVEALRSDTFELVEDLDDDKDCNICCEGLVTKRFAPCMHACACDECSLKLTNCPVCRIAIQSFVLCNGDNRTFLPST